MYPSLLRKLKVDFGVEPKLPENGEGLHPEAVLEAFRVVLPEPRWKVLTDMQRGLFSFSKYLMCERRSKSAAGGGAVEECSTL